jgi:glycosyltransferase involved in cell wall biosynthesis
MDFSVVVPTRNRAGWLGLALQSAMQQRDVNVEVIVVDDASTDDTSSTVAHFDQSRIRLIRRDDPGGVSVARNQGAAHASGEWLAFLDDDDVWAPDKLTRQHSEVRATDRDWCYTGWVVIDERLSVSGGRPPPPPDRMAKLLQRRSAIPTASSVMVRRDVFEGMGGFDPELTNGEDWELWIRLTSHGPPAYVPEPLVAYRLHPGNASLDSSALQTAITLIQRRHGIKVDRGSIDRWIAESHLRTGKRAEALKYLALAAMHGDALGVASDLLAGAGRWIDRRLGHPRRTFQRTVDPLWVARAQRWLDEFAPPLASPRL